MSLSRTVKEVFNDFHIRDLEMTLHVSQGQGSGCTFIILAMVKIFLYRHPWPRRDPYDATGPLS